MEPTIGRIVHYRPTPERNKALVEMGYNSQDLYPAIIVAVWGPECVNLKVILDGPGDMWITSANKGDEPGMWSWPVIK